MATGKPVKGYVRLQIPAGQATPAPPVGPALGQQGVNIVMFTKEFNERTRDRMGMVLPVVITVYEDKSFTFITKSSPASNLLKKAANLATAAHLPGTEKAGKVTRKQVMDIVEMKKDDLNAVDPEQAFKVIAGTARSMGIEIVG